MPSGRLRSRKPISRSAASDGGSGGGLQTRGSRGQLRRNARRACRGRPARRRLEGATALRGGASAGGDARCPNVRGGRARGARGGRSDRGQSDVAGTLWGAANALLEGSKPWRFRSEPNAPAEAKAAGAAMSLDEAVAYALRTSMRDLPSGTVTFLFTDVEGSTRLLHELGAEAYAEALAEHRRVLREASLPRRRRGGYAGRRLLLRLPYGAGAVAAREAMTRRSRRGRSRCGSACTRGRRCSPRRATSETTSTSRRASRPRTRRPGGLLAAAAELVEARAHRPRRAPAQGRRGRSRSSSSGTAFPPLKTISNTNLPRPASSFVGRDDELVEVLSRFEEAPG